VGRVGLRSALLHLPHTLSVTCTRALKKLLFPIIFFGGFAAYAIVRMLFLASQPVKLESSSYECEGKRCSYEVNIANSSITSMEFELNIYGDLSTRLYLVKSGTSAGSQHSRHTIKGQETLEISGAVNFNEVPVAVRFSLSK